MRSPPWYCQGVANKVVGLCMYQLIFQNFHQVTRLKSKITQQRVTFSVLLNVAAHEVLKTIRASELLIFDIKINFLQPKIQLLEMYEDFVMLSVAVHTFLEITPNLQLIICYLAKCG